MPVTTDAVGFSQSVATDVTPRWALAYAASLGFVGEQSLDDARPGGCVVPPMFCVCLEWALAGSDERRARLGLTMEERRRGVHAFQDSHVHGSIRPGMRVLTTSRVEFMRDTSAGAFVLTRYETRDAKTDELLIRSWSGSIVRGIALDGPAAGAIPPDFVELPAAPATFTDTVEVPVDRGLPHVYSECARIWNPIHTERVVALEAGLPDIILHGTATWALAAREVVRLHGAGDVSRLRRVGGRFRAPVVPGGTIAIRHAAAPAANEIRFVVSTDGGAIALADGVVTLAAETG